MIYSKTAEYQFLIIRMLYWCKNHVNITETSHKYNAYDPFEVPANYASLAAFMIGIHGCLATNYSYFINCKIATRWRKLKWVDTYH